MQEGNIKSVMALQDYGSVKVNLRAVLDKKGITRNKLAQMTNTRFEVVDKWFSEKIERIDIDILARFCFALDCDVTDILVYHPMNNSKISK